LLARVAIVVGERESAETDSKSESNRTDKRFINSPGWVAQETKSHFTKGAEYFFAGRIKEALVEWDAQVKEDPSSLAGHWQRGLALYYAERYKDGRAQFEEHQKVNPEDVENAVWHFLCVTKAENVEAARKVYIPITHDTRVPMKEIHALYAGKGTEESVIKPAEAGEGPPEPAPTLPKS